MSGKAYRSGLAAVAGVTLVAAVATPARAATSWSVLTTPNRGSIANELYGSAALSATSAWAVGSWYDTNLAAPRTLIERWNGTSWSTVTSPNATQYYNELRDVDAGSATDAWAVGYANGSSGVNGAPRNALAMRWNGTAWSVVATPQPGVNFRQLYGVKAVDPLVIGTVPVLLLVVVLAATLGPALKADGPSDAFPFRKAPAGRCRNVQ